MRMQYWKWIYNGQSVVWENNPHTGTQSDDNLASINARAQESCEVNWG